ncbi:MAG: hypothetical protein IJM90_09030 [Firmicutes bacterium]|nr:hypothetical protein [Bacillota bacterium]
MAIIKMEQERGKTVVRVSPEPGTEWIRYQKEMAVHGMLPHLPPVEETEEGILEYRPLGIPLEDHLKKHPEDAGLVMEELRQIPLEMEAALLDAGQCRSGLKELFWDQRKNKLQVIFVPEESDIYYSEWLELVMKDIVQLGISEQWEAVDVCYCYEFLYKVWFGGWEEPEDDPEIEDLSDFADVFPEEDESAGSDPEEKEEDPFPLYQWEDDLPGISLSEAQDHKADNPFSRLFSKKSRTPN